MCMQSFFNTNSTFKSFVTGRTFSLINELSDQVSLNCKSKNVIYLISCTKCCIQYVGMTTQQLNTRFNQHKRNILHNNLNTMLVKHFNSKDHHCRHLSIQIIDYVNDNTDGVVNKLLDLEAYWMKTLNTIYPYGLNDQVKGVGLISKADISTFNQSNSPFFSVSLSRSWRSHGSRKPKRLRKNSKSEISTVVYGLFDCFQLHGLNSLYTSLRGLSHGEVLKLRYFISGHSNNFTKQFMDCLYAFSSQMIKPSTKKNKRDRLILVLPFLNQITDELKLSQIISSKVLRNKIPSSLKFQDTPMISFKYGKTIGQTIFNYNRVLENLNDKDLDYSECDCSTNKMYSKYVYKHHGHVHTGDMDIVKNSRLQMLMKKGAQFRERKFYTRYKHYQIICEHLDNFVIKWAKKEKCEPTVLKDWLETLKLFIHHRLKTLLCRSSLNGTSCTSPVLGDPEVVEYLDKLHSRFVIVPVDKASKNFAFICKSYYIKVLMNELGVKNSSDITGNSVYKPVQNTIENIIEKHKFALENDFNITLTEKRSQTTFPLLEL